MDPEVDPDMFAGLLEESAEDLYENAPCGYLSTLPDGTIARVNATFLRWTGYRREDLVGHRRFQALLAVGDRIFYETHYAPLLRMQHAVREIAVEVVCADGRTLPVLINATATTDAHGAVAHYRTSVFDARQRREYERELLRARRRAEESEARARVLARTLQQTFIPPQLPRVPGLDVGGSYRAAFEGDEVGGDFYDVFATGDDEWVAVLGDVRGKGVAAARVTALARHTIRAGAMSERAPAGVLALLNEALRRSDEDRFCTAVYARLRLGGGSAVRVTLAVGGHALPLLIDRAGRVTPVGAHGDLIGVFETPALTETEVQLRDGESLCMFTDGVTDGRRGSEHYGEDRAAALLSAHASDDPSRLARRLVDDVVGFQSDHPRDDIAVVVLRPSSVPEAAPPG